MNPLPLLMALATSTGLLDAPAESPAELAAERAKVQAQFPAEFAPVADDPALPRVLLIGDSISIGYTQPVRELLRSRANVHRVPENGGPTRRGLQRLGEWLGTGRWDVIHFNFGLHDIKRDDRGRPLTSPDEYTHNLREIVQRLQATRARLIFATTTPVPHPLASGPRREPADVPARNAAAVALMRELAVPVNDLFAVVETRLAALQQPGNVHFNPEGSRVLGKAVAAAIQAQLPPRASAARASRSSPP